MVEIIIAITDPSTDIVPFMQYSHGIELSNPDLFARLIPVGKGIPKINPRGIKSKETTVAFIKIPVSNRLFIINGVIKNNPIAPINIKRLNKTSLLVFFPL